MMSVSQERTKQPRAKAPRAKVCNTDTGLDIGVSSTLRGRGRRERRQRRAARRAARRRAAGDAEGGEGDNGGGGGGDENAGRDRPSSEIDESSPSSSSSDEDDAAEARRSRAESNCGLACCWRFWSSPILLPFPAHSSSYYDPESGRRVRRRRAFTSAAPVDMLPLVAAIFTGHFYIFEDANRGISSALAASLAYMVTGAYLLGIVQMLVFLNAAGARRLAQVVALWLWAGVVAAAFYFILRHFVDSMHETEANKAALLASVCSCVISAVSPQLLLWMLMMMHRPPHNV